MYNHRKQIWKKIGKIIILEDSSSQQEHNELFFELKKNPASILRCLIPANLKQVG